MKFMHCMELKYGYYSWALHGGACPPNFFIIFVNKLSTAFKRKCNCDCCIRMIVLLQWLTALLEYLDLALHLIQALHELLGALTLASYSGGPSHTKSIYDISKYGNLPNQISNF